MDLIGYVYVPAACQAGTGIVFEYKNFFSQFWKFFFISM